MNFHSIPQLGQSDLLYEPNRPQKRMGIFKPAEPHSPWDACLRFLLVKNANKISHDRRTVLILPEIRLSTFVGTS